MVRSMDAYRAVLLECLIHWVGKGFLGWFLVFFCDFWSFLGYFRQFQVILGQNNSHLRPFQGQNIHFR